MTANRDFKRLIRKRMRKTGESYTAARRHFLHPEEDSMTRNNHSKANPELHQPIERLQLTLKTARILRNRRIETVGQLANRSENELADLGLDGERRIEVREVLASRGL